jgi:hypothetical protein
MGVAAGAAGNLYETKRNTVVYANSRELGFVGGVTSVEGRTSWTYSPPVNVPRRGVRGKCLWKRADSTSPAPCIPAPRPLQANINAKLFPSLNSTFFNCNEGKDTIT